MSIKSAHDGPFDLEVTHAQGTCRLLLKGEFDLAAVEAVEAAIDRAFQGSIRTLELDLSELTFLDSSGLRVVLEARDRADAEQVELRLRRGSEAVQRVFRLTGLEDDLPFAD